MTIHSTNVKIMISAIRSASRVVVRDFYEINKLQGSYNSSGIRRFPDVAYNKSKTIIEEELQRFRPDFGFSKEDNKQYYWKINPIDGKYNFSRAIPSFAISISLIEGDEVVVVVIILPTSGELFWAERGVGAYIEDQSSTSKLRLRNSKDIEGALIGLSGINGKIFRALQGMQYRIIGSIDVSIAYIVTGKMDALLYVKGITNNSLLVKEALGSVIHVGNYCIVGNAGVVSAFVARMKNE